MVTVNISIWYHGGETLRGLLETCVEAVLPPDSTASSRLIQQRLQFVAYYPPSVALFMLGKLDDLVLCKEFLDIYCNSDLG